MLPSRTSRLPGWVLPVAVLAWTAVSWGGRIGLLTAAEAADPWTLVRVGGSWLVGVATAASLWRRPRMHRFIAPTFVAWTVVLWARTLITMPFDAPSAGFVLVHLVLAVGWFALAWAVWTTRWPRGPASTGDATATPDDHVRSGHDHVDVLGR